MRKEAELTIEVPEHDGPSWGRVGVIAAIGFVIGIAWPKLAGVKLGPSAPAAAPQAAVSVGRAPEASHAVALVAPALVAPGPSAKPSASGAPAGGAVIVTVAHGGVLSCRTEGGETLKGAKECGASGFDAVAQSRLKNLGQCTAAAGASGKLSAVFTLDYGSGRMDMNIGKSSTMPNAESFLPCLRTELSGVSLKGLPHQHSRYVVAYSVHFEPASSAAPVKSEPSGRPAPAGEVGGAVVAWEVALVRDTPKTGGVIARLPRGTKVTTTGAARDGWFMIRHADGEGWVYRGAIGR